MPKKLARTPASSEPKPVGRARWGSRPTRAQKDRHDKEVAALREHIAQPTQKALSDTTRALELFPGDLARAPALYRAFLRVTDTLGSATARYDLDGPEQRTVLRAVLASLPGAPTAQSVLPDDAPELWSGRDLNRRENAPAFIRRVYAPWLGQGLARKDLARLDPDLYKALNVWLSRHPEDDIGRLLPSQSDAIDDLVRRLSSEYPLETLRKLGYAIDARLRREEGSATTA